jgi:hypothetical protein
MTNAELAAKVHHGSHDAHTRFVQRVFERAYANGSSSGAIGCGVPNGIIGEPLQWVPVKTSSLDPSTAIAFARDLQHELANTALNRRRIWDVVDAFTNLEAYDLVAGNRFDPDWDEEVLRELMSQAIGLLKSGIVDLRLCNIPRSDRRREGRFYVSADVRIGEQRFAGFVTMSDLPPDTQSGYGDEPIGDDTWINPES